MRLPDPIGYYKDLGVQSRLYGEYRNWAPNSQRMPPDRRQNRRYAMVGGAAGAVIGLGASGPAAARAGTWVANQWAPQAARVVAAIRRRGEDPLLLEAAAVRNSLVRGMRGPIAIPLVIATYFAGAKLGSYIASLMPGRKISGNRGADGGEIDDYAPQVPAQSHIRLQLVDSFPYGKDIEKMVNNKINKGVAHY